MAAAPEGLSCIKVKLPGIMDFMKDSQPLFFPYEEKAAPFIQLTSESHYQAFYLPKVCGIPLGLGWPTTISFEDLLTSIQCLQSD
jgi:hypothetical protein